MSFFSETKAFTDANFVDVFCGWNYSCWDYSVDVIHFVFLHFSLIGVSRCYGFGQHGK